jgi:cathepsin X
MHAAAIAVFALAAFAAAAPHARRPSEVWSRERTEAAGITWRGNHSDSHDRLPVPNGGLPQAFTWCNQNGTSYCTISRNQHIPQYCGSCWAHGSVSALGDRVKIARKAQGIDINLSVQHILNCANVGSCYGGSVDGPYQWLHSISRSGTGISYETSNSYLACSSDVKYGLCPHQDWSCTKMNIARTCSTFPPQGKCVGLSRFPNVTISDYGSISGAAAMQKEIFNRGPITCGIDAAPILDYTGGVVSAPGDGIDHVISVVGWGYDAASAKQYWIVRNSWGEYWGEMGYVFVELGRNALHLEEQCSWAVVQSWVDEHNQAHCSEDGSTCS